MFSQIELNHLKYFYLTVLEGGVAPAAERLHVQQPVVSKMLKNLEDNLEKKLFWKQGRSKKLTDYGQLVYRHCQLIFTELEKINDIGKEQGKTSSGLLALGGAEPIVNHVLEDVLMPFTQDFPHVHVNLLCSTQSHLLKLIEESKLDLGFFFYVNKMPESLELHKSFPVRFKLVIKKEEQKNLDVISSFIGSREIDDPSTHRFPTVELMRKTYPKTKISFSSNSISLHKSLVLQGRGVSILPEFLVEKELKEKLLVDLYPKEKFVWDVKLIKRKSHQLTHFAEHLIDLMASKLE